MFDAGMFSPPLVYAASPSSRANDGAPVRFSAKPSRVLLNTDIDCSLLIWNNLHQLDHDAVHLGQAVAACREIAPETHMMATTSRSNSLFHLLSDYLRDLPLRHFSTNNGQELFSETGQAKGQWKLFQPDPLYQKLLASKCHWSVETVQKVLKAELHALGFRAMDRKQLPFFQQPCWDVEMTPYHLKTPSGESYVVTIVKDQPSAMLWPIINGQPAESLDETAKQLIRKLAESVSEALAQKHIQHHYVVPEFPDSIMVDFAPDGIDKRFVTEYMVKSLPEPPEGVITIDDNHNGKTMLEAHDYTGINGKKLPNYPIVVGNKLMDLESHPRMLRVQRGGLGDAILRQFSRASKAKSH